MKNSTLFFHILRFAIPSLLTLLWLGFIFNNSLQDSEASTNQSQQVQEIVNQVAQSVGIEEPVPHSFIRKGAHFTEFAILGLLLCLDLVFFGIVRFSYKWYFSSLALITSVPLCAVFATVDELLQNTAAGRAPQVTDVLIDTAGALVSSLLFIGIYLLIRFLKMHKQVNTSSKKS